MAALQEGIATHKQAQKEAEAECKRLEKEMDEFKNNREGKLDELKKDIAKKRAELTKQTAAVKAMQREVQTSELELEQMDVDIETSRAEIVEARKTVEKSTRELGKLEQGIKQTQTEHDEAEAQLRDEAKQLSAFTRELDELDKVRKRKETEMANLDVEEKRITHDIEKLASESKKVEQSVKNLENKYTWIVDESASFGKSGSSYDFSKHDMSAAREKCNELSERQQGRSKKINPKVMAMIDQVEKQEKELVKMYTQVEKDKVKIEQTIDKLDNYKKTALTQTWEKVNGDFGAIFGDLLPGNFSKLQPPDGMDITQGLEVKVRLGSVWKQSLTELSGGQRYVLVSSIEDESSADTELPLPDPSLPSRSSCRSSNSSQLPCTSWTRSTLRSIFPTPSTSGTSSGPGSTARSSLSSRSRKGSSPMPTSCSGRVSATGRPSGA